jgi:hypothetical protein
MQCKLLGSVKMTKILYVLWMTWLPQTKCAVAVFWFKLDQEEPRSKHWSRSILVRKCVCIHLQLERLQMLLLYHGAPTVLTT